MQFQVELTLDGVKHGLDGLLQGFEELLARAGLLTMADGSKKGDTCCGQSGFDLTAVVVPVRDEHSSGIRPARSASSSMSGRT